MTKEQEQEMIKEMKKTLETVRLAGMKAGATGMLGAVLDMCNQGRRMVDIKKFCENPLAKMKG